MVTPPDLHNTARNLAAAYHTLTDLATTPPRQTTARKMRPTFGPQSPNPDGDWALNLTWELTRETPNDHIPGGLRTIACDALSYTPAHGYRAELRPTMLCAHVARWSRDICAKFPAADELDELMNGQIAFIHNAIANRYGKPTTHGEPPKRHTSDVVCAVAAQRGHTINPKQLREWKRAGKISGVEHHHRNWYLLGEVLNQLQHCDQKHT